MWARALLLLVLSVSAPAWAQDSETRPAPADQPATIDATKLGVSLARIQKGLRVSETREKLSPTPTPLRLEFSVQVYGFAPRIDLLKDVDILHGDAPGTAPTHRQIVEFLTPQIYRQQAAPISALAWWAGMKLFEKSKKSRCEEEIADYRAMLMQGMNIAAPRCTQ